MSTCANNSRCLLIGKRSFRTKDGEKFYKKLKDKVGDHYKGETNGVAHNLEGSLGFNGIHLNVKDGHLVTPTRGPQWAPNVANASGLRA